MSVADDIVAVQASALKHLVDSRGIDWIIEELRKQGYDMYLEPTCHCGHGLNGWSEPACTGCYKVPELCYCARIRD